jgi:peptidoglycan/xylan/chitin deacetylase (PgdA/CDA1 family)
MICGLGLYRSFSPYFQDYLLLLRGQIMRLLRVHTEKQLLRVAIVLVLLGCVLYGGAFADTNGTTRIARWKRGAQGALSITFDDNGITRDKQAAILEEYGLRGTFNIITSYADKTVFLDMFRRGHELGSHTVNHPPLNGEDADVIWTELSESKQFIEELTGQPCVTYVAPYGELGDDVVAVAKQLYISARGVYWGVNSGVGADLFRLFVAPYPSPWGTTLADNVYLSELRTYIEDVLAVGGWGVEMWHNLTEDPNRPSSGQAVNERVYRAHLEQLVEDFSQKLWIAPQGRVARYYLERDGTAVKTHRVSDNVIIVDLQFEADAGIFNEPLTLTTEVPDSWLAGTIIVAQDGVQLDYEISLCAEAVNAETCLMYDALPAGGGVTIIFEPILGDLDGDGDVDANDLAILSSNWLENGKQ